MPPRRTRAAPAPRTAEESAKRAVSAVSIFILYVGRSGYSARVAVSPLCAES